MTSKNIHPLASQRRREPRRTRRVVDGPFYSGDTPPWAFDKWQWETPEQKEQYLAWAKKEGYI